MGISDQRIQWLDCIVLLAILYSIGLIILYWLGCIVLAGLYSIDFFVAVNTGFYALACYWLDGTDRTNGPDGILKGRGWDRPALAGARTGAPTLDLERRRATRSGGWHQLR